MRRQDSCFKLRWLAVFVLALAQAAFGASPNFDPKDSVGADKVPPLRLEDLLAQAREQNPEILVARAEARAAAAVPGRRDALDDPEISYEAWNFPDNWRVDRADNSIFKLSQKFPFPGKLRLAGEVAERDADMANWETVRSELDVVANVTRAFVDLWREYQDLGVYQRDRELAQRIARIAESKYAVSEVPQSDVVRAQSELTRLLNRITTQKLAITRSEADLNALLSGSLQEPLGAPEDPLLPALDQSVARLTELALAQRPELRAGAVGVQRAESGVRLAKLDYYPNFEVSISRFQNYDAPNGFGLMGAMTIPLAFRDKYRAGTEEAEARVASARAQLRRMQDVVRREVAQAFASSRAAQLQNELFVSTHIPQSEQVLRVSESDYRSGTISFIALVDAIRTIEATHLEHQEAAADFLKSYADLERAVGGFETAATKHVGHGNGAVGAPQDGEEELR